YTVACVPWRVVDSDLHRRAGREDARPFTFAAATEGAPPPAENLIARGVVPHCAASTSPWELA
ncbi:MAG: hypothetical protein ACK4N5_03140, partial [Myxococcales bacterium]